MAGRWASALAKFFILEFLILLAVVAIMGIPVPLDFIVDICTTAGTTPISMAVAFFTLGTLANMMLMFVLAVNPRR